MGIKPQRANLIIEFLVQHRTFLEVLKIYAGIFACSQRPALSTTMGFLV
jgi:hypothetical protein